MKEFDDIFLSWRQGQGHGRHIVGVLRRDTGGKFTFRYFPEQVEKAQKEGFSPYTEFPDITQVYNGNVLDIFSQRLIRSERADAQTFYDFWEVEPTLKNDKFYLLGHTQGLLPTDNFEFLADYKSVEGIHFLTELAGLNKYKLPAGSIKQGDILTYQLDPGNKHDPQAVKVFKNSLEVGFIKRVHCMIFHKAGADQLKLTVKAVDENGTIKRVFIKVFK